MNDYYFERVSFDISFCDMPWADNAFGWSETVSGNNEGKFISEPVLFECDCFVSAYWMALFQEELDMTIECVDFFG